MAGRKPKPTKLRILHGNPGKRPLNKNEPQPGAIIPRCPPHLCDEAKKEWRRMVHELHDLGLLTKIDKAVLALYCQAWGRWVEAEELLKTHGVLIKAPSGYPMQSPVLAIANKAMEQIQKTLGELGMTPSSRSRISISPKPEKDPLEEYLKK